MSSDFADPPPELELDSADGYYSYGRFDPLAAKRILVRFKDQNVRFQIADASGVIPTGVALYDPPVQVTRANFIEIFVHRDDDEKAQRIISDG